MMSDHIETESCPALFSPVAHNSLRHALKLWASTVMVCLLLGGCAGVGPLATPAKETTAAPAPTPSVREVNELLEQPAIDPLTRYLDRQGPGRSVLVDRVRTERDKRCGAIAESYASRDKTAANLEKLESGYRYSCPAAVQAFAEQVNRAAAAPARAPVATPQRAASLDNCYLPFAIKNYRDAREACRKPAEMGDARAQYNLGVSARVLQRFPEAVEWTQRAAAQGLPEAQLHLGLLYQRGQGFPQDSNKALQQFELAAAQGLAEAQFMAGLMYYRGEGVKRDLVRALRWFAQAAEQGHGNAQLYVGRIYSQGEGVPADLAKGRTWLLAAAKQREPEAQFRLGTLYAQGLGVEADALQAYVWLSLAVAGGHDAAVAPRDEVARKLSKEQLANARLRVRRASEGMH